MKTLDDSGLSRALCEVTDDRHPRMSLLLEHLNEITYGKMRADIQQAKQFVIQQAN